MGELSGIKPPDIDWNDTDFPTAFQTFKQYCQLIFNGPLNKKEEKEKVTNILIWIGEEGLTILTPSTLAMKKKQKLTGFSSNSQHICS